MLSLRLILKSKSGKQHCLPFVGSNLSFEKFLKKNILQKHQQKGASKQMIQALLYTLYWGFKKIQCKACLLFYCFLLTKRILIALVFVILWLMNLSDFPRYGSNSRKRYKLRLLPMPLEISPPISGINTSPHPDPLGFLFGSLR